jgi:hypothetical protein
MIPFETDLGMQDKQDHSSMIAPRIAGAQG